MRGKVPEERPSKKPGVLRRRIALAIDILLFATAIVVLHKVLTSYHTADIARSFGEIGRIHLLLSLFLTALGYAALVGYDYTSVLVVGRALPLERLWAPSFISHAIQNSAPVAIVAGGGIRYKLFRRLGLSAADIGTVVGTNVFTFILGLLAVAGLAFVLDPVPVPSRFHLPVHALRPLGVAFLVLVVAVGIIAALRQGPITIGKRRINILGGRNLALQLAVSSADWLLSAGALYVLYAASGPVPFVPFLSGFLLVQIVTQVVPLPGGIGVFEAAMLLMRPSEITAPQATAALLTYRVIYYLVPLIVATALLAHNSSERQATGPLAPVWRSVRRATPQVLAVLTFLSGLTLLSFGAIAAHPRQAELLQHTLPVAIVEGSRLLASLVGVGLLILAWGLARRVHGAFRISIYALMLGIPLALFRSMDLVSAAMQLVMLLLLIVGRKEFSRRTPLTGEPLNAGWVIATFLAVSGVIWLGIFARIHGEYASQPWWKVTLDPDAPADLRLVLLAVTVGAAYVGTRMVARARRVKPPRPRPSAAQ